MRLAAAPAPPYPSLANPALAAPDKRGFMWRMLARFGPIVIGAYLIGKMFYVFSAGSAQPADMVLALFALAIAPPVFIARLLRDEWPLSLLFLVLIVVNFGWLMYSANSAFWLPIIFYTFDFLVVAAVISARERDPVGFDKIVTWAIAASAVIQAAVVLLFWAGSARSAGTFLNPNQLAYWAICTMAIWVVLRGARARPLDLVVLALISFCQIASLSRGGIVATAVGLALWGWLAARNPLQRTVGVLMVTLLAVAAANTPFVTRYVYQSEQYSALQERMARQDEYASVTHRSLGRILEHPEEIVLGAGEGAPERFTEQGKLALEIHSSWGTLLFSYGVIGLTLFVALLVTIAIRTPLPVWVHLVPALMYSTTHQGLRFTPFWILIGVLLVAARRSPVRLAGPSPAAAPVPAQRGFQRRDPDYLRALTNRR